MSVREPDKFFILYLYPYLSYICLQPLQRRTCYKLLPWVRFREPNRKNATEGFGGQRVVGWLGGWMDGWVGGWLGACIPYFTLSPLPYVSRMAPHASIVRPSGSPHVPCVSPAGPPYVPACSLRALRVFLASPACPPVCSRMFPRVPRMFPA